MGLQGFGLWGPPAQQPSFLCLVLEPPLKERMASKGGIANARNCPVSIWLTQDSGKHASEDR